MYRAVAITLASSLLLAPRAVTADSFADDEPEGVQPVRPVGDGVVLVGADSTWQWKAVTAPRLDRQIGAVAIAGLDLMLGRRDDAVAVTGPEIPAPDGWPLELRGGAAGPGPFALPETGGACDCQTPLSATDDERVAVLYAQTSFELDDAHEDLRVLELRARYRDGITLWLNGVEVANRFVDAPQADRTATRTRGPEWEIFRIPTAPGLLRAGANHLAVEVRPAARGRGPMMDVEIVGRRKHGIARGPMLQRVGDTTATVVIETELIVPATLSWGAGKAIEHRVESPAGKRHVFDLTGLPASGMVTYRVEAGDDRTADHSFHTAPGAKDALRVAIYGDVRGGHGTHRALLEAMRGESPDLVLATGDIVGRGHDEGDWQRFFAVTGDVLASIPYYVAIGNHDVGRSGDEQRTADQVFATPPPPANRPTATYWYAYDIANVHFVFLDSNAYERREQREWFEQTLADARKRKVRGIIVSTHDGPYSRGSHRGNAVAQRDYVPLMTKYRVDLIFSGHDHTYQRGNINGLEWICSGGGGASLYSQACGLPGKRKCAVEDGMIHYARTHHYVMMTIDRGYIETCARKADGTEVEPCVRRKLKR